jgi:hypothetical protein
MIAHHAPHTPRWRRILSLPQTSFGWWSVEFVGAFVAVQVALGIALGVMRATGLPTNLAAQPWLMAIVLSVLGGLALAAVGTGLIAVVRRGERSIIVIATVVLPIIFVLGEVIVPWLLSL